MYEYNCPDCNEAKLQSDKNARKINEVIDQVNALIQVINETVDFIEEKANEVVEEIAEIKVNETLGDIKTSEEYGLQVNSLNPFNDNISDIGSYHNRFKNLYLSGGVRVGSTSTENRPIYGSDVKFLMHYDYDINRYIMWDGSNWREIPFDDVRHGNGTPWFAPLRIGQEYYDLQNKKLYKSFGTTMNDWFIVN